MHAAGAGGSQVNDPLFAGDEQVLLAVAFLLAAVVFLLLVLVLGSAYRPLDSIEDQQAQVRYFGQECLQVSGTAGGQKQLTSKHRVDQGRESLDPLARLGLAHAKEQSHHFLQGVALEIKQEENQLGCHRRQLASFPSGPERPLARKSIVALFQPLCRQEHLQTHLQTHELRPVQGGQCPQKPPVT